MTQSGHYCSYTFEVAKAQKKGGATGNQTQGPWLNCALLCAD